MLKNFKTILQIVDFIIFSFVMSVSPQEVSSTRTQYTELINVNFSLKLGIILFSSIFGYNLFFCII